MRINVIISRFALFNLPPALLAAGAGAAIIAMIISRLLSNVPVEPVTAVFFVIISLSGMFLAVLALDQVRD